MLDNLRRELRLRLRQAVVISAGLGIAAGAGLLTTAGPASAAPARTSHPVVQIVKRGQGCQIKIPFAGRRPVRGPVRVPCCPLVSRHRPGRQIRARWHLAPVTGWPGRTCKAHIGPGGFGVGVGRHCPAPPPLRCKVQIKRGQGG